MAFKTPPISRRVDDVFGRFHRSGQQPISVEAMFLRPRRFGKSLLLSMLANYYDLKLADKFDALFGDLAIGQQPTPEHNQYLILRWDFSQVSWLGDAHQIQQNLFDHINLAIKGFEVTRIKCRENR